MNIFSRRIHGVVDYAIVVVLLSLPTALGFSSIPRSVSYALAFTHLLMTGLSSFAPGGIPIVSARLHGIIESVFGVFLLISPWLLRISGEAPARNSFLAVGATLLILVLCTDFDRRRGAVAPPPGDRRRRWSARKG